MSEYAIICEILIFSIIILINFRSGSVIFDQNKCNYRGIIANGVLLSNPCERRATRAGRGHFPGWVRGARAPDTNNSGSGSVIFDEICNFKELDILKYEHTDHDIQNPVRVATQEDLKLLASTAMLRENHPQSAKT